ncbi:hypothetical protein INS49_004008 [Diaporthe citri]|uniref:uncharacterized protein n=1 Tax=Diaporthe citri TaxID=83186 RepID=UPI001C8272FF|nr:uncharacterized protein INS49_004008 [Diaporthe citri]KAG6354927.1 hypothetical protein INS49_004008 [Diaporthe citri]
MKYVPGGYHPVDIGDKIAQYTVLHKLGSGGFATVWLVQSSDDSRYYALKSLCADVLEAKANEPEVMEHLGPHDHPNVAKLLRSFEVTGPNGVHTCLVRPVYGPSLYQWAFTLGARHRISQQVSNGVAFLHERGVVHAHLTTSDVVFNLPSIQLMSPDEVCQLLGPIEREKLKLRDSSKSPHGPKRIVNNPDFSGFNIGMSSAAVMIIDFGEARQRLVGIGLSAVRDTLWQTLLPLYFPIFEMLIGLIVHHVGLLPRSWQGHFDAEKYGDRQGRTLQSTPDGAWYWFEAKPGEEWGSLGGEIAKAASGVELSTEQQGFIVSLLQDMLACETENRLTARDTSRRIESAASLFGGEVVEHLLLVEDIPDAPSPPPPPEDSDAK